MLSVGDTGGLTATVTPANCADLVTFTSNNSSVATVSGSAPSVVATGMAAGSAQVQAVVGTTVVAASSVLVADVGLSPDPLLVGVGRSKTMTVTGVPLRTLLHSLTFHHG